MVSPKVGDIFKSNSLKNGLLPVEVSAEFHLHLLRRPAGIISIDLLAQSISLDSGESTNFSIAAFAKYCLLQGVDQLGYLLSQDAAILDFERKSL